MPNQVSDGATLKCTFGAASSKLAVLPQNNVIAEGPPAANIKDHLPMVNIKSFGMCRSLANPMVAAATIASYGVLKPMRCIPITSSPWTPGAPNVLIGNQPALDNVSQCMCQWGGVIKIVDPATTQTLIP